MITPESFTRVMADLTRLRILMLLMQQDELCVCQLTDVLDMVQPKISRHLAVLRENGVLLDRREGLWIFYRLHPELPDWCHQSLQALAAGCKGVLPYSNDKQRLGQCSLPEC